MDIGIPILPIIILWVALSGDNRSSRQRRSSTRSAPEPPSPPKDREKVLKDRKKNRGVPREVLSSVRKASKSEYKKWLKGFLEEGGEIRYDRNREFDDDYFFALRDFELPHLTGSSSLKIIVPKHVEVEYDDRGHNELFFMEDYTMDAAGAEGFTDLTLE